MFSSLYNELVDKKTIHNTIARFIYVVNDLDGLIENIKNLDYKDINEGSQRFRANGSYLNYSVTALDND